MKYILPIIALTIFTSCKKISSDDVTFVKGYVFDPIKNKKLANAQIEIYGCRNNIPYGISCSELIASTQSGASGEFQIKFTPNGRSIEYRAEIRLDENFDSQSSMTLTPGITNDIVLNAREFNYLKSHIIVTQNPLMTLASLSGNNVRHILVGNTLDTIVYHRVLPNATSFIRYSAWDPAQGKYRRLIDTLQVGMADTSNYNRVLPSVSTFPLH